MATFTKIGDTQTSRFGNEVIQKQFLSPDVSNISRSMIITAQRHDQIHCEAQIGFRQPPVRQRHQVKIKD
jgi:hypothetical protein